MSLFSELKRRNVLRVGAAYIVTAWLIVQVVETLFPIYGLSDAAVRMVVNILAVGLVPVLVLSWVFEWTPEGLKKDKDVSPGAPASLHAAKRLDRIILMVLALALGYFALDKFVLEPQREAAEALQQQTEVEQAREEGRTEAIIESYGEQSIAVLAFDDMSQEGDQEYLSDGIAEEILHLLEKIDGLRVISRTSAFSYKGKDVPIPAIAEQLDVAHILEGSVRKAGNRIRVTAQLIEARTDTHLWSETYDRTLDDIFAIQDELAAAMVEQLQIELLGEAPVARRIDPEAYLLYLEGHHFAAYNDPRHAIELLEQAVEIEPDYLEAWLDLSQVYLMLSPTAYKLDHLGDEFWEKSNAAARKASEIDPAHPAILAHQAWDAMVQDDDLHKSARLLEQAILNATGNWEAAHYASVMTNWFMRDDIALELLRPFLRKDPLCRDCRYRYARSLFYTGRYAEAAEEIERFRALSPGDTGIIVLMRSRLMTGNFEGAREALRQHSKYNPNQQTQAMEQLIHADLLIRLASGGTPGVAEEIEGLAGIPDLRLLPVSVAELYALSGQYDKAFEWLQRLVDNYQRYVAARSIQSPFLEGLHEDPRWLPLLEQIGVAPHQLAEINFNPKLPDQR